MDELRSLSEIQIQSDGWRKIWKDFPEARRCLFHVPNESTYNNSQQSSSGVIPGIQDMIFVWGGRTWYIELKDATGVISDAQKVIHSLWKRQGFDTYVFYNEVDFYGFIRDIIVWPPTLTLVKNAVESIWADFVSPYSTDAPGKDYEHYLKLYQDKKKTARENKSRRSLSK